MNLIRKKRCYCQNTVRLISNGPFMIQSRFCSWTTNLCPGYGLVTTDRVHAVGPLPNIGHVQQTILVCKALVGGHSGFIGTISYN